MFKCQLCSRVVPPRTPACRLVVETRRKRYPPREKVNRPARHLREKKARERSRNDPGGEGVEIVRELRVCPQCARRHRSASP